MVPLEAQRDASGQNVSGRRSARLPLIVPITIKGTSKDGGIFRENTWTMGVNKHGAKLATFTMLAGGDQILVENPIISRSARARVIRVGAKRYPEDPFEIAVELFEPQNIWGVKFPPHDWLKDEPKSKRATATKEAAKSAAITAASSATPETPGPAATSPAADTALFRFAKRGETAPGPKPAEEKLAAPAQAPETSAQDRHPDAALLLEERLREAHSLEQALMSLAGQLQQARGEGERVLEKLQALQQDWKSQADRTREEIDAAGERAVLAAVEALGEKVQKELEPASSALVEQARAILERERTVAVESALELARKRLAGLVEESAPHVAAGIQAAGKQAVELAKKELAQQIDASGLNAEKEAEVYRKKVSDLSATFLSGLTNYLQVLSDGFKQELDLVARELKEKSAKAGTDRLEKLFEENLESAAKQLHAQVADAAQMLGEHVEAAGKRLAEEAAKQLAAVNRAARESLRRPAEEAFQAYERDLRVEAEKFRESTRRALEAHLNQLIGERKKDIARAVTTESEAATERALAAFTKAMEQSAGQARDDVHREVGKGTIAVKDYAVKSLEDMNAKFRAASEAFLREIRGLSSTQIQSQGAEAERFAATLRGRLQAAADALGKAAMEKPAPSPPAQAPPETPAPARAEGVETDELLDNIVRQARAMQEQAVKDALESFRQKFPDTFGELESDSTEPSDPLEVPDAGSKR